MALNDFVLASGPHPGGGRAQFKAVLLTKRRVSPHLLVRYVGDQYGRRDPLTLPDNAKAYLTCREVSPWIEPKERPKLEGPSGAEGADEGRSRLRTRPPPKSGPDVLLETGGMPLHLDPRRITDGYMGTGYLGVAEDWWHCGFKKLRPFVVSFDGAYAGRFATVEQAAVQYARLEAGMPPLVWSSRNPDAALVVAQVALEEEREHGDDEEQVKEQVE